MNKTTIKNFAVWARVNLIEAVKQKAYEYEIKDGADIIADSDAVGGRLLSQAEKEQRSKLIRQIKAKGYDQVMEEAAYTWFNRFIALRYMEINGFLPSRVRVFSNENGEFKPDILAEAMTVELDGINREKVFEFIDKQDNEGLYKYLLITQCNALGECLPGMFERIENYTELLFPNNLLKADSIIGRMISDIPEDDWLDAVQIIGWMYQYYISQKHDEIINIYKGTIKKDDIPAATQLFTTDWVVRYMVDNSLGRYWIERNPESKLAEKLDFFATPKDGKISYIDEKVEPTELTFFDPCMGSGHILVYAFDVLMEIYRECGYSDRDAALNIVQNNLFGLDIDERAYQLAYFAIMMKARSYNRRALSSNIKPNVLAVRETNSFNSDYIKLFKNNYNTAEAIVDLFMHAREYGSLITVDISKEKLESIKTEYDIIQNTEYDNFFDSARKAGIASDYGCFIEQALILSKKYAVVCTNPPYMNKLDGNLKNFVVKKFKAYSGDLFSVFMYRNFDFCKPDGYSAFMTPFVWMFIKTYEELRSYIIKNKSITSLIQMEYSAFEEATVPICSFVLQNCESENKALCFRLSNFKGGMEVQKQKVLEALSNKNCGYFYEADQSNFSKIPGSPVAYWVSDRIRDAFSNKTLYEFSISPSQNVTGDNGKFVRKHWELRKNIIGGKNQWIFYAKGGGYRKWWGNLEDVVNWTPKAREIYQYGDGKHASQIINKDYWYKKGITWGLITSALPSFRIMPEGATYDKGGSTIIVQHNIYNFSLGLLNSKIYLEIISMLNPTLNFQVKDVRSMPLITNEKVRIDSFVDDCIELSKSDWDSFETSWDFKKHPLV